MTGTKFEYEKAFSRNIGWISSSEQNHFGSKKVAIAGCGGVGGIHTLTLARLGIGKFSMADFDAFGLENFNRQVGATMTTVGQPKLDVMVRMLKDINPEAEISLFEKGINTDNLDNFLNNVDIYIDSLDFFAMDARRRVFCVCAEKGIPAITAAPLGFGTALLCFMPGYMTFEDYFGMEGASENEQYLRFLIGLAPNNFHAEYLIDPSRINLKEKKGPSTISACTMSAAFASTYAAKILLKRGEVLAAPKGIHCDPYLNRMEVSHLPKGHLSEHFQNLLNAGKKQYGIE